MLNKLGAVLTSRCRFHLSTCAAKAVFERRARELWAWLDFPEGSGWEGAGRKEGSRHLHPAFQSQPRLARVTAMLLPGNQAGRGQLTR